MRVSLNFLETPATPEEVEIARFLRDFAASLGSAELATLEPFYHPDSPSGKRLRFQILETIDELRPQTHAYIFDKVLIRVIDHERATVFFQRRTRPYAVASWQTSYAALPLRKYRGAWRLLV